MITPNYAHLCSKSRITSRVYAYAHINACVKCLAKVVYFELDLVKTKKGVMIWFNKKNQQKAFKCVLRFFTQFFVKSNKILLNNFVLWYSRLMK